MTTILIAEDDVFIAEFLAELLTDSGYVVCGIAATVAQAVALAGAFDPDLAVLDGRLASGGRGTDVAAALQGHTSLGILYATGSNELFPGGRAFGHAWIAKPYDSRDMLAALRIVAMLATGGAAPGTLPRGVRLLLPPN